MIVLILAVIVSLIPITLLLLWLRKYRKGEEGFKKVFDRSFGRGVLSVLLVVLFSAVFYVLLRLSGLKDSEPLLYEALYTFIVLAFAEEAVKLLTFSRVLRKSAWNCSWLDAIVALLLAAADLAFGIALIVFVRRHRTDEKYTQPLSGDGGDLPA